MPHSAALLIALGLLLLGATPSNMAAQTVEGRVVDSATGAPVYGVQVTLRNEHGAREDRTESERDGAFFLASRSPGIHWLEVTRRGFEPVPSESLELGREVLEVEIRLSRAPIELAPIVVIGQRRDLRHDATFQGALARHRILPRVGGRRVVLRSEPEFRSTMVAADILRWFPPGQGCTVVFSDGFMARTPETASMWLNDVSTEDMEAVEFYRQWADAPLDLKDFPPYVLSPTGCSVVAIWPRADAPARAGPTGGRALKIGGVLGAIFLVGALVAGP